MRMRERSLGSATGAAPTTPAANDEALENRVGPNAYHGHSAPSTLAAETEQLLFAHRYRDEEWRFCRSTYTGSARLSVRAFYEAEEGEWRPTGRAQGKGFTMPLEAAVELGRALVGLDPAQEPEGNPAGS
jgi:hypothetical protein